jgi:deoxyribonuclease-4
MTELPLLNLGAHISIAGGIFLSCERARDLGCDALQIFVKNERRWGARPIPEDEAARFRKARKEYGLRGALAHDSYLINLASPDRALREKSAAAFMDEMERCETLGIEGLVTHPGSPGEAGEERGLSLMAAALDGIFRRTRGFEVRVLLETTAGQGSTLGWKFEQLASIRDRLEDPGRLGFCLDTCHAFAAGYDLSTPSGYDRTMEELDRVLGLRNLRAIHVNDSRKGLGSRVDRHEHIGRGEIGLGAFRKLMRDPRLRDVPKVLETPKEGGMDAVNLGVLRRLAGVGNARPRPGRLKNGPSVG